MITMGDEYGHTKKGNNNTYCQDNELSWFLWDLCHKNQEQFSFFCKMIAFRKERKALFCQTNFLSDEHVTWHGKKPNNPDWSSSSQFLAYSLKDPMGHDLFLAFNASKETTSLTLPTTSSPWHCLIDTSLPTKKNFLRKKRSNRLKDSYELPPFTAILCEN